MKKVGWLISLVLLLPAIPILAEGLYKDDADSSPHAKKDRNNFEDCRVEAQKGNAEAMGVLGLMYEKGIGIPQNQELAVHWLQKAAQKGDAPAQNNLGFLYLKGRGLKPDNTKARQWFEKAAAQGLASAQENLGLIYGGGLGVKKNYEKAFGWFKKAAEQDDAEAQTNLGIMYSLGEGGPKDFVESLKWFTLALQHNPTGDELANLRDNIEWLEKRMKGKETAEARKRAAAWKPSKTYRSKE